MIDFDKAWLEPDRIHKLFQHDKVYVKEEVVDNEVSLRLRSEIVDLLDAKLVESKREADIFIEIDGNFFKSDEAYTIKKIHGQIIISGNTPVAALYGLYAIIREPQVKGYFEPDQHIRMINQWDQVDGTVERGYAGASIFFGKPSQLKNDDNGSFSVNQIGTDIFRRDYERVTWYARLLASIGINAISLNNVNVRGLATNLIIEPYLSEVSELAKIFTSFGIKTYLAINWEAPKKIGGLDNSDPLDVRVQKFWKKIITKIYSVIPNFGGFVVKADSEGEPGPYAYGRTHAEGANMLAKVLKPFNGKVFWRTFVYDSKQDWRDRRTDRAKAAFESFAPLDGQFDDNVALQIKFGPIDFQTVEPLSPLFGKLQHTNQIMEFEITAEYLGQQIDVNYVLPQWLRMIHWDTNGTGIKTDKADEVIKKYVKVKDFNGFTAVSNVGMDLNWTGNKLAQANLYAFGRMCWTNETGAEKILDEWIAQTFDGIDEETRTTIFKIMITSNDTFKKYNAPLGVGFMVQPHYHYGVSVNGYEYDRWGTYHFADRDGVGVDRTKKTGTGFTELYAQKVARQFENYHTTPVDLILFFHHLKYKTILANGTTLIQTIYDNHFCGYELAEEYLENWRKIKGKINNNDFENVLQRLTLQVKNALEWRDQVNTYFYRMSGIPDARGRKIYN